MVDLSLTETQLELQLVARRFLRSHAGGSADDEAGMGRPDPSPIWREMAGLGWLGLTIPPERGGVGASAVDAGALYQELGRGPLPGPIFEAAVLAPALMMAADAETFAETLARTADGRVIVVPLVSSTSAPPTRPDHVEVCLSGLDDSGTITGQVPCVRGAGQATEYLVVARSGAEEAPLACVLVDAAADSVTSTELAGFAPGLYRVEFDDTPVMSRPVLLGAERLAALVDSFVAALPVLCAFQVGSCQAVLDMTIAYSTERVAFGNPIGSFQRVQDHVIEIVNGLDAARWTTYHALWRSDTGGRDRAAAHVAKAVTSEAHAKACTHSHEVHAGIGTDLQYGLAVHTRLARTLYSLYGDPYWHRQMLAAELGIS